MAGVLFVLAPGRLLQFGSRFVDGDLVPVRAFGPLAPGVLDLFFGSLDPLSRARRALLCGPGPLPPPTLQLPVVRPLAHARLTPDDEVVTLLDGYRTRMSESPLLDATIRVESASALDGPGRRVGAALRSVVGQGGLKRVLRGDPLGHPLHPLLTDLVIGSFVSANVLDLFRGVDETAAERLILVGLLAYPPTALSGASDWSDSEADDPRVRRVGLLHAGSNSVAFALYAASLVARRRGEFRRAKALGLVGAAALGGAGYLGAHLSYVRGVGVDATASEVHREG